MEEDIIFINCIYHHPKTNCVVESFNKTIKKNQVKAEYVYNITIHTSTKIKHIKAIKFTNTKNRNYNIKYN